MRIKLVASMPVRNELGRYLRVVVPHLLSYCDEVVVLDDGSTDGSYEWLREQDGVVVHRNAGTAWQAHEGEMRQHLLDLTLEQHPSHILAIDADELVPAGEQLRPYLSQRRTYTLQMTEVWRRDPDTWWVRADGGWRPHPVCALHLAPARSRREWQIWGGPMASGRVPRIIREDHRLGREVKLPVDMLHLGWSDPAERAARYERYMRLDGGQHHDGSHLASIMWPDDRCKLTTYHPPRGLADQLRGTSAPAA